MNIEFMLFILFVLLQVLDSYTTYVALEQGQSELSPIMNFLFKRIGILTSLVVVKLIVVFVIYWYMEYFVFVLILDLFYIGVVTNNFLAIRR